MALWSATLMDAKAAGATAIRCAMLSGRRYEKLFRRLPTGKNGRPEPRCPEAGCFPFLKSNK